MSNEQFLDRFAQVNSMRSSNQPRATARSDCIDEPTGDMYEQFAGLIKQMQVVMKNFQKFFCKYLQPEQNHFLINPKHKSQKNHYLQNSHQPNNPKSYQNPISRQNKQYYEVEQQQKFEPISKNQIRESIKIEQKEIKQSSKKSNLSKKTNAGDPNKPKTPLTPYFLFFQQNRDLLRKKYPQMSLAQIGTLGGKIWGHLSAEEKQRYKDRYEQQRRMYVEKMRIYHSSGGYLQSQIFHQKEDYPEVTEIDDF